MDLVGVRVEVPANTPMVLLREREGRQRLMPIFIGNVEATAIHYALEQIEPPRPLTHDLFANTLEELTVSVSKVLITEVREHTYYAELHLVRNGEDHVVSSRPSDAIALAVRTSTDIYVDDELLDEVGQDPTPEPEEDSAEIIDEFRDFIENVSPEDFAG